MMYIPDDITPNSISREYLLSVNINFINFILNESLQVIAFADNELYLKLYEGYKQIKEERQSKKWGSYQIEVAQGVKDVLDKYQSIDSNTSKGLKPLRFSKNGKELKLIKKINAENLKEKIQEFPEDDEQEKDENEENEIDMG